MRRLSLLPLAALTGSMDALCAHGVIAPAPAMEPPPVEMLHSRASTKVYDSKRYAKPVPRYDNTTFSQDVVRDMNQRPKGRGARRREAASRRRTL
jgi:hypothetical protein